MNSLRRLAVYCGSASGSQPGFAAAARATARVMVEREVDLVINRRMKRQGMRWTRGTADGVVALRVREYNAAWDDPTADQALAA